MPDAAWQLKKMEEGLFKPNWSPDINPVKPDYFAVQQVPSGVQIFCGGKAYAGQLAAQVNALMSEAQTITFKYTVTLDGSISVAQVIETDNKFTDAQGWTYDGSLQWDISKDWMLQVNNPWVDAGVKMPLKQGPNEIAIAYKLDYAAHTLTVVSVNDEELMPIVIPAKEVGWQKSSIVTQLQLCVGAAGGVYDLTFGAMSLEGQ